VRRRSSKDKAGAGLKAALRAAVLGLASEGCKALDPPGKMNMRLLKSFGA
jgi:hypothetical protein